MFQITFHTTIMRMYNSIFLCAQEKTTRQARLSGSANMQILIDLACRLSELQCTDRSYQEDMIADKS